MKTLLVQVHTIEQEAQELVDHTRKEKMAALHEMQSREEDVLAQTRAKAQERGKKIIAEQLSIADKEVNSIKQQGDRSVAMVHKVAEKNRADALKMAHKLFSDEYGT